MAENRNHAGYNENFSKYHGKNSHLNEVAAKKGLKAHWISYLAVNALLMLINLLTMRHFSIRSLWFLYPLLSWGIGISIHSSVIFINLRYPYKSDRGFYIHFAVILTVSVYLLLLNIITWPYYPWFAWPVAAMAVGIGEHYAAYKTIKRIEMGREVPRLHALWYPGVACFFLVFIDIFSNGEFNWFWWPCVPIMLISFVIIDSITKHRENLRMRYLKHHSNRREFIDLSTGANSAYSKESMSKKSENVNGANNLREFSERRYCPRCGEENLRGHAFCEYCGLKLD
ncbi:MAG: 2TM domain-containing protein [Promethearchaeota archaeon]